MSFALRVRLVKKFADCLNGVDLTDRSVGEIFDCSERAARMLALEGWAEVVGEGPGPEALSDPCDDEPSDWHSSVKVRILRQPRGRVDGISLTHYHAGQTYELPPTLASYLVIEGFAIVEMRHQQRDCSARPSSVTLRHGRR